MNQASQQLPPPPTQGGAEAPADSEWRPGDRTRSIFDATMLLFGVAYLVMALQLPLTTDSGPSTGFFPLIAAALMVACFTLDLAQLVAHVARGRSIRGTGRFPLIAMAVLGLIGAYLVMVPFLGHALAATIVAAALVLLLGRRPWWQVFLIAVISGFGTDFLFSTVLGLPLPTGLLGVGFDSWI